VVDAFHRGVVESGRQARVMHLEQAVALGAAALAARYPVLVAAGLYVTTDEELALLEAYAAAGGHLLLGVRTGYADAEARARVAVAPPALADAAGAHYEEFSNLEQEVPVVAAGAGLVLDAGAAGRLWADGLLADDAQVLARYEHPRFGDFAAVTTRTVGTGRVTTVGCVPNPRLAADLVRWASPGAPVSGTTDRGDAAVTVSSGTTGDGRRLRFAFRWGWTAGEVSFPEDVHDAVTGEHVEAGRPVALGPWGARVLVTGPVSPARAVGSTETSTETSTERSRR
jgi:beta-galactosidase